jgi:hypothetical protein
MVKIKDMKSRSVLILCLLCVFTNLPARAQLLWTVGVDDNAWPQTGGGGPDASFVQENGVINPLPGDPLSPATNQQADNDYYFAGSYTSVIPGVVAEYGAYDPVGDVAADEVAAERAFAGGDLDLRYHFNLPVDLKPTNLLTVTFDANNLHTDGIPDPRFGIEVWVNGVKVQDQIVIRGPQLDLDYTTPAFTLESVGAKVGPGPDNIVSLHGISYNSDGGGNWMGIDYVQLDKVSSAVPASTLPWFVGMNDNAQPTNGVGGGPNAAFLQENGTINPLPGSPKSVIAPSGADNDYYFAGLYTNVVAANGTYQPVGLVSVNEEGSERAFAGADNALRFHFNLPNNLVAADRLVVSFDPLSLDTGAANSDPRYGIEVYFNNVLVQTQLVIRPPDLNKIVTTAPFTVGSVNAGVGPGTDNIVTLKGTNYNAAGGGNWMGFDFVSLAVAPPAPALPWSAGLNDDAQPTSLNGGGVNAAFVQENGTINPLPGSPVSTRAPKGADNDYYFAGIYNTVISTNPYTPVGVVSVNEDSAERAFAGGDNDLRFHFNLPASLQPTDQLIISYDPLSLDTDTVGDNAKYGIEVYFNDVKVQDQVVIHPADLNKTFFTPAFTAGSVGAQTGPGFDNIISLRGINYNADGSGNWMGFDFVELSPALPPPFPWSVGKDDNTHLLGTLGGGPNTSFVQESGSNPPPGSPFSPQVDTRADDDYYFTGVYTNVIPANATALGDYEPIGVMPINEQVAERAFAGTDNEKRYHFNLPSTLQPTNQLIVRFDANNLDGTSADPFYGVEIYVNSVQVLPEVQVFTADLDKDFTSRPFTLQSVDARVGPGWDNIVTLRGINHNADGGGNWMGIDYVQLSPLPTNPVFPWSVGKDDNGWPTGDGGGENTSFVQENGSINDLPGSASSREISGGADNDYYFAGIYTNTIPGIVTEYGAYDPVGIVPENEEAAERAFAASDNDLRYHFNLPATLQPTNQVSITFDALNLDTSVGVEDPRYGIEVYFNGVKVQDQIIIHTNQIGTAITTPPFTLASVNAQFGPGYDNIVSLKGINFNGDGGGNWMGFDYIRLNAAGGAGTNAQPAFVSSTVANGKLTLTWTGTGNLESAPSLAGPWTPVTPTPSSPYTEDVQLNQKSRFYRLKQP